MSSEPTVVGFVMHGTREAMAGGLPHVEEQVKGIERAVIENPGLAFDLAKTVVESACRTILGARGINYDSDDDLPRLFKVVTTNLPVLPVSASGEAEARRSLIQMLNGLHTALQGICELRNAFGFSSHGGGGPRPVMESAQALLAAQAADAIVGFLHRVHRQDRDASVHAGPRYDDNKYFNSYIDEANERVQIFELSYLPSEVLFAVDPAAYRDLRAAYEPETAGDDHAAPTPGPATESPGVA